MSHFIGKVKNCFSISVLSEFIDFPPLLLATLHSTSSDIGTFKGRKNVNIYCLTGSALCSYATRKRTDIKAQKINFRSRTMIRIGAMINLISLNFQQQHSGNIIWTEIK